MLPQQTVALLLSLRVAVVSAFIIIAVIFPVVLFVFFLVWLLPHEQLRGYQPIGKVGSDAFV